MRNFFGKKSRSAFALVIAVSFALHLLAILIFGTIKFVSSVLREETVMEAVSIAASQQKEQKHTVNIQQRTLSTPPPRPPAIMVNDPSELDIPALDINVNVESSSVYERGGGSFGGGLAGIREMSVDMKSLFGASGVSDGLLGSIYDLRRKANGTEVEYRKNAMKVAYLRLVEELVNSQGQLDSGKIEKYFKSSQTLGAATIYMPSMKNTEGPVAFGMETLPGQQLWLAHYKGMLKAPKSGRYRFVGSADEVLIVRINGKLVFDGTWRGIPWEHSNRTPTGWKQSNPSVPSRKIGPGDGVYTGDWFSLSHSPFEMEVIIGEGWGGSFGCVLAIEEEGVDYQVQPRPIFKTADYRRLMDPELEISIQKNPNITFDGPAFEAKF